ncbi:DUF927 domain-containing protein|uniref:Uncharcterized protein, DUF927 family n=1 Tax=Dendrosporobacter quercicolus TaxID=146817 RepID=A0A1G9ZSB7_9FIRM|nr:DUF927 domain-containing protein [Dendrosporobacter quercicolus]NSL49598.1 DUF927 domain-containing protein [Dendrosporobacter quercicolus DSM 1736]SDN24309.1 Uncharcterized protein, DUF927 family [Dendrosporobacter quercicolus]
MQEDIDKLVDWKQFYSQYLPGLKPKGDELHGLCPFHNEKNPSFGIKIKTGQYKCLSCGASGNAWTFLQEYKSMSKEEATKTIMDFAGIKPAASKTSARRPKFTIEEYATVKRLDIEKLQSYGIKNSHKGMVLPYMDEKGNLMATRYRHSLKGGPRFTWVRGSKVTPYGLWMLRIAKEKGYIIIVEGESDCHTLWEHDIPALGVPGADTFQPRWAQHFEGLNVYLYKEPEQSGEIFIKKVCKGLLENHFSGKVYLLLLQSHKDPSDLHLAGQDVFKEQWAAAINMANPLDIRIASCLAEKVIDDQPFTPIRPENWRYSEYGVYGLDEKGIEEKISPLPVIITKRLQDVDTQTEKLEVAWRRHGKWESIKAEKATLFQYSKIAELANTGMPVSSKNAKEMVSYLFDMEAANMEFLPTVHSVSHLGWLGKDQFLPGHAGEIALDMDAKRGMHFLVNGFEKAGDFDVWKTCMEYVIQNPIAQLMLAGSFASPLLQIIGHRNFIIHVWGASKGGKTAAMKAALSVWGNPERIMVSFNATQVGLERTCQFLNNLPLGVDERQLAGDKQEFLDKLVYAVSAGQGKTRGDKGGGLQAKAFWNLVVLTTGEESLAGDTSHSGVRTRALELYGIPLPDEKEASNVHRVTDLHYGHAGVIFMKHVLEELRREKDFFHKEYSNVYRQLQDKWPHIAQPHISAIAVLSVAHYWARQWVWGITEEQAKEEMIRMAVAGVDLLSTSQETDYVDRAWDFTAAWIASNDDRFREKCHQEQYGYYDSLLNQYWLVPSIYKKVLTEAGYSVSRVLREFYEKGFIDAQSAGGGKMTFSVMKRWKDKSIRMIVLKKTLEID